MTEDLEIIFLRTYKDFIYSFNMLDRNMATCLNFCLSVRQESNSAGKWRKATFDKKLKKILSIANKAISKEQYEILSQKLEECRRLRNVVVHGHWEWKWWFDEPIYYHAPEPYSQEGSLTLKTFQEQLSLLEEASKLFRDLRPSIEAFLFQKA